jgi:uncharacterized glyoxalase superfamily protein PhnB
MADFAKNTRATVIPALRYRDAAAAVDFLCDAFGFDRHLVIAGDDGRIAHAELSFGSGMIMLGSHPHEGPYGQWVQPPGEDRMATQGLYVIVTDVDAHYARALENGAEILLEPRDEDYGGRDYTCRDAEGHIWTFGSYDPWLEPG